MLSDARRDSLGLMPSRLLRLECVIDPRMPSRLLRLECVIDPRLSADPTSIDSRRLLGLRTK